MSDEGRKPALGYETVLQGEIARLSSVVQEVLAKQHPDKQWGLGVAKVMSLDYEELHVTLRIMTGSSGNFVRLPVPLTFPGAGTRHFFGAMPQIGDYCIVGWMPQESSNPDFTRTPVILSWLLPGVWPARDWATTAGFPPHEFDMGIPKNQDLVRGVHDRIRRKLRHMQPGNIVASSAQGSDLVLDEGVILSNRRGNEIRLRDQDQALVVRSLQQFHAMAGARTYAGMVQRDATFLATQMLSDGQLWDGSIQAKGDVPVSDMNLPEDLANPTGALTPARPLAKQLQADGTLGRATLPMEDHVDPYNFLRRGGFLDARGYAADDKAVADAVYGGKPIFRVAAQSSLNATLHADAPTLTEYRVELNHTSDGRLPVTEQTDQFDADRLPPSIPESEAEKNPATNRPFIEWVLGSVVGNDPYSKVGREAYGLPLVPIIFDGDKPSPRLAPARIARTSTSSEPPTPIEEHAATLFRVQPPVMAGLLPDTFWSVNKKGQLKAAIGGPTTENSVEAALAGGLKLSLGGRLTLLMNDSLALGSTNGDPVTNVGVSLQSDTGAVVIHGGGKLAGADQTVGRTLGNKTDTTPSVLISAQGNASLTATQNALIKANAAEINASAVSVLGHQTVAVKSAESVEISSNVIKSSSAGKTVESFSGPKDALPTNGALHERVYSPVIPGLVSESVTYQMGDRKEMFYLGNHETKMLVGNMTYQTLAGTFSAKAGANSLSVNVGSGIAGVAANGNVTMTASSGTASLAGVAGVTVTAAGGSVLISGSQVVALGAPIFGPDQGPIICAGTLEPFTGLPFSTWGLGAKSHICKAP